MHALGIQSLAASQIEQRQQHVAADFGRAGSAGDPKAIPAAGDFDIESTFDLPQVFVELTAQVCETMVIGGLEDNVPKNPDSIQDLYSKPLCKQRPVRMTGASPLAAMRVARYLSGQ